MYVLIVWVATGVDMFTLVLRPDPAFEDQILHTWVFL